METKKWLKREPKKYNEKPLKDYLMFLVRNDDPVDYSDVIDEIFFKEYWYPHSYGSIRTYSLRRLFPDSYFLPKCYDESIVGIDPITESIIYNLLKVGRQYIMCTEDNGSPSLKDQLYGRIRIIDWVGSCLDEKTLEGKVPPTLVGCLENIRMEDYGEKIMGHHIGGGDNDFEFCNGYPAFSEDLPENVEDTPEDNPELSDLPF